VDARYRGCRWPVGRVSSSRWIFERHYVPTFALAAVYNPTRRRSRRLDSFTKFTCGPFLKTPVPRLHRAVNLSGKSITLLLILVASERTLPPPAGRSQRVLIYDPHQQVRRRPMISGTADKKPGLNAASTSAHQPHKSQSREMPPHVVMAEHSPMWAPARRR
jgi:hypothetical protein